MSATDLERGVEKKLEAKLRLMHKQGWDESPGGRYAMTTKKAARALGVSQRALRRLIRGGSLWLVPVAGRLLVPASEVERLSRSNPPAR